MPLITETYYLSLTQDNRGVLRLRCSQDDTLRTVNLKLYNNGSIFVIPSGISAYVSGVKQNGAVFSKSCTISQDRESVVFQLSSDITSVDGIIVAEIVLNDGSGGRLGASNFIIQVEKNPMRAGVVQDTETPIEYVNDFITQIQALTARVNNLITPNGDPSLAEVVDARISSLDSNTYQNLKARIDADIATLNTGKANKSEVYTKSQVDNLLENVEIDVDDELSDESENPVQNKVINRAIGEIKADLGAQTGIISKTPGYYINLATDPVDLVNLTPSNWYSYSIIECTEGDKFVINAVGSTNARTWGFLDSSNHVLSRADENTTATDLELTAPTNAAKLIINDKSGGFWYKVGNNLATRVGAGLSNDVKEALLDCFRYVAWVDDSGQLYFNALAQAMGLDDFYNTQEWDKSNGLKVGLGNLIGEYKNSIVSGSSTSRAIAWCERGRAEIYSLNNNNPISFNPKRYPIPIPAEATGVTIEYTGPYALNAYIYVYDPNTKTYTQDISQMTYTVRENGRAVVEFNRQGQNQFLVPYFLVGSAAAPTNVTIIFK